MLEPKLFQEYAEIKNQIKALEREAEAKLEALKPLIIEEMRAIESDRIDTKVGQFILTKGRKTWTYTSAVAKLKKKEEEDGSATCKQGEDYLTFRSDNLQKTDGDH